MKPVTSSKDRLLEERFNVCPECSAPWRLHWVYIREGGERRRRYNTCSLTRTQIAAKWLKRAQEEN